VTRFGTMGGLYFREMNIETKREPMRSRNEGTLATYSPSVYKNIRVEAFCLHQTLQIEVK
jgi:hypothetical protein